MLKDSVSPTTALANMVHTCHLWLRGIDITMAPCNVQGKYRLGNVQVMGMLCHIKDLRPIVGSKPSSDNESDSEGNAQFVYLKSDLLSIATDISTLPADANLISCSDADGSLLDESSSKDEALVIPLRRSAQQKRPAPNFMV